MKEWLSLDPGSDEDWLVLARGARHAGDAGPALPSDCPG